MRRPNAMPKAKPGCCLLLQVTAAVIAAFLAPPDAGAATASAAFLVPPHAGAAAAIAALSAPPRAVGAAASAAFLAPGLGGHAGLGFVAGAQQADSAQSAHGERAGDQAKQATACRSGNGRINRAGFLLGLNQTCERMLHSESP